jgi:putative membrane protein
MNRWKVVIGRHGQGAEAYARLLTETVADIEKRTSATLGVVVHGASGNYRDVAFLFGAVVAWCGLLLILFLPNDILHYAVPLDLAVLFALSAWICSRTRLRRWLTTNRRRHRQVRTAADAAFVAEGLHHAHRRTGILVYWSRLERRIEVIANSGVISAVPVKEWHAWLFAVRRVPGQNDPATAFLAQLNELGRLLEAHLPHTTEDPTVRFPHHSGVKP